MSSVEDLYDAIAQASYTNLNKTHDPEFIAINTTIEPLIYKPPVEATVQGRYHGQVAYNLEHFSQVYFTYHGYLSAFVCAFGIPANLANIVVLTRKNMISSTNWILTWLAVADLLTMCSYLPVSFHFYVMGEGDDNIHFPESWSAGWIRFLFFHSNFSVVCHTVTIWLTIALAIFRYIYVCYPTQGSTLCTIGRAKLAIFSVYISTVITCIPNTLCYGIITMAKNATYYHPNGTAYKITRTLYKIGETDFVGEHSFVKDLNFWIQALLVKLIPCVGLTILTVLLILAMKKANQRRMHLKSQGRKDDSERAREHNRTTGMLLAVVVLFLITEVPQGILTILNSTVHGFFEEIYMPLGDVLDMMALLNNAINFVLYCTMSRQFRETFVKEFCRCCPERRPGWLKLRTFEHKNGTLIAMKPMDASNQLPTCHTDSPQDH
ncbi:G-protein coupled receptor dmsr-1-like [Tubulanus polymorphus]|uniref:G-protein coupled receptor dmsr-1-like n=1 Tax=Tubulanus polymorphus TaxID=672921 RepID=UPI003DA36017